MKKYIVYTIKKSENGWSSSDKELTLEYNKENKKLFNQIKKDYKINQSKKDSNYQVFYINDNTFTDGFHSSKDLEKRNEEKRNKRYQDYLDTNQFYKDKPEELKNFENKVYEKNNQKRTEKRKKEGFIYHSGQTEYKYTMEEKFGVFDERLKKDVDYMRYINQEIVWGYIGHGVRKNNIDKIINDTLLNSDIQIIGKYQDTINIQKEIDNINILRDFLTSGRHFGDSLEDYNYTEQKEYVENNIYYNSSNYVEDKIYKKVFPEEDEKSKKDYKLIGSRKKDIIVISRDKRKIKALKNLPDTELTYINDYVNKINKLRKDENKDKLRNEMKSHYITKYIENKKFDYDSFTSIEKQKSRLSEYLNESDEIIFRISEKYKLPEEFMDLELKNLDWNKISLYSNVNSNFLIKYKDYLNIPNLKSNKSFKRRLKSYAKRLNNLNENNFNKIVSLLKQIESKQKVIIENQEQSINDNIDISF